MGIFYLKVIKKYLIGSNQWQDMQERKEDLIQEICVITKVKDVINMVEIEINQMLLHVILLHQHGKNVVKLCLFNCYRRKNFQFSHKPINFVFFFLSPKKKKKKKKKKK